MTGVQTCALPISVKGHQQIAAAGQAAVEAANAKAKDGKPLPEGKQKAIRGNAVDQAVAKVTILQEIGGMVGRVALAVLALMLVSRRSLLRIFQIPSLFVVPALFWWISQNLQSDSLSTIKVGIFLAGFFTVAQFSFWGNYIPLVFPLHLRGTGESFAANIGGRVLGTAAAFITITLSESKPPDPAKIALMGAYVAGAYALVGAILTQWLPEPPKEGLE